MYGLIQTMQSPLQFNWCGNGLTYIGSYSLANTGTNSPVYISRDGAFPSVYTNNKGTLNYTFVKGGYSAGKPTLTGTANNNTSFSENVAKATAEFNTTNYALTITDSNTGQSYTYNNSINWGGPI